MEIKAPIADLSPAAPEVPAIPAVPDAPKPEMASAKLELFAKREASLVKKQQEIKAFEDALKTREEKIKKYENLETNKPDPITLLQQYGYSYEDATNMVLNGGKPTADLEVRSVKEELEKFKREQLETKERERQEMQERQQAQARETVENFKAELSDYIVDNKEQYELINLYEQSDLVFETIQGHFDKTKRVLSSKEAADLVEKHLEGLLEKGTKTGKWAKRQEPSPEAPVKDPRTGQFQPAVKTLTNHMVQPSTPSSLPAKTEADRMARALAALEKA